MVDDEEQVRTCVSALLTLEGYSIVEAADGLEALHIFQISPGEIELVLMDVTMPNLDGVSAAKRIKQVNPSTKVILMSGFHDYVTLESDYDAYLPKPFRSCELFKVIKRLLPEHETPSTRLHEATCPSHGPMHHHDTVVEDATPSVESPSSPST